MSKSIGSKSNWKTPPPPEYLPCPPPQWIKDNSKQDVVLTFCKECENVFYVYDKDDRCIRQYLYQCNCLLF